MNTAAAQIGRVRGMFSVCPRCRSGLGPGSAVACQAMTLRKNRLTDRAKKNRKCLSHRTLRCTCNGLMVLNSLKLIVTSVSHRSTGSFSLSEARHGKRKRSQRGRRGEARICARKQELQADVKRLRHVRSSTKETEVVFRLVESYMEHVTTRQRRSGTRGYACASWPQRARSAPKRQMGKKDINRTQARSSTN